MTTHIIALTGGPCSGKTTSLAQLSALLRQLGFQVLVTPEIATLFALSGVNLQSTHWLLQKTILTTHINYLNAMKDYARINPNTDRGTVILCDRGAMDVFAYSNQEDFDIIADGSRQDLFLQYDTVFHLTSAAKGAQHAYGLKGARYEDLEAAAKADDAILQAWGAHPHRVIIDNRTGFDEKMKRLCREVCNVLGLPKTLERERKFLVHITGDVVSHSSTILQSYLHEGNERVRRREWPDGTVQYTHTLKRPTDQPGVVEEFERRITPHQYADLYPNRVRELCKVRHTFESGGWQMELDVFSDGMTVLEIEGIMPDEDFTLPPFLELVREVTGDHTYANTNLAKPC